MKATGESKLAGMSGESKSEDKASELSMAPANSISWIFFAFPGMIAISSFFMARWFGWSLGWLYIGNFAATHAFGMFCAWKWNPILFSRRATIGRNTKPWDVVNSDSIGGGYSVIIRRGEQRLGRIRRKRLSHWGLLG